MSNEDKLSLLETLLDDGTPLPSEDKLNAYLTLSEEEILQWLYSLVGGVPDGVESVPAKYEVTQIYAVLAGYTHAGAEGQSQHNENGIHRIFLYSDMVEYIHNNVTAYGRLGSVSAE